MMILVTAIVAALKEPVNVADLERFDIWRNPPWLCRWTPLAGLNPARADASAARRRAQLALISTYRISISQSCVSRSMISST